MKRFFGQKFAKGAWRLAAALTAAALCAGLAGCQSTVESSNESGGAADETVQSMGRYVEAQTGLDGAGKGDSCMVMDDAGAVHVFFYETGEGYVSSDNGESWSAEELSWYDEAAGSYILGAAVAGDGTAALELWESSDGEGDEYTTLFLIADADGETRRLTPDFSEEAVRSVSRVYVAFADK